MDLNIARSVAYPDALAATGKGGWCFEFWLNRYQTLLAGICTLAGAGLAAIFVVGQTRVARDQLGVMLGDIQPDFLLEGAAHWPSRDFRLHVQNQNRRPIELTALEIVQPPGLQLFLNPIDGMHRVRSSNDERQWNVRALVPGTRPSAGLVSSLTIEGRFALQQPYVTGPNNTVSLVEILIRYAVLSETRTEHARAIELRDAHVSMMPYSNDKVSGIEFHRALE